MSFSFMTSTIEATSTTNNPDSDDKTNAFFDRNFYKRQQRGEEPLLSA